MRTSGSEVFDTVRDHLASDGTLRREVENAFGFLLARANPSDRAARFVVGGAAEWIVAAAAWASGVLTSPAGHNANGFDLQDLLNDARGLWSVKFMSQPKPGAVRITNGLGGAGRGLTEPTVFIHRDLGGLLFVDPVIHLSVRDAAVSKPDAVEVPFAAVKGFALAHPQNVARFAVPINEGQARNDPFAFVKELMTPEVTPLLSQVFAEASPPSRSVVDAISELNRMMRVGEISVEERASALKNLLS